MKLYELAANYVELMNMADEMDSEAIVDTLEAIRDEIELKAENIAKLIRNLEADARAIREEEKRLNEKRTAIENKVKRLKAYLFKQLEHAGIQRIKRPTITVYIQDNPPSVDVVDISVIPEEFLKHKVEVDKKSILERIKSGEQIPGVELKREKGVRIR
ncbi:siphovirus Gp157 family protein [Anoxybacillus geothermalis]|nr:siphovirus Gp157 family protein [Anoxybacillus geothermalis]